MMTLQEHSKKFLDILGDPFEGADVDEIPMTAFVIEKNDNIFIAPDNISKTLLAVPREDKSKVVKSLAMAVQAKGIIVLAEALMAKGQLKDGKPHLDPQETQEVLMCFAEDHNEVVFSYAPILKEDDKTRIGGWVHEIITKDGDDQEYGGAMSGMFPSPEEMAKGQELIDNNDKENEPLDLSKKVELEPEADIDDLPVID